MKELTLKELQNFCIEIMQDIHDFCVEHDIKYSLYAGSMLGAVRHKGFIPWDDDLDIIMPRPDYERFCNEYRSKKFEVLHNGNCSNYYLAFARVCDRKRTTYTTLSPWTTEDTGCWIDVFPADGFPSDKNEQYTHYEQCIDLRAKCIYLRHIKSSLNGNIRQRIRMLIDKIKTFNGLKINKYVTNLCSVSKQYDYNSSEFWASLTNVRSHKEWKHHPKHTFDSVHLTKFEDREFYIADGFETILTQRFNDYMKLPPIEDQVPKQGYIHFYWR